MFFDKKILLSLGIVFFLGAVATALDSDDIDDPQLSREEIMAILPRLKSASQKKYAQVVKKCLDSGNCTQNKTGDIIHPKLGPKYPVGQIDMIKRLLGD